jgi:hypothetical protein
MKLRLHLVFKLLPQTEQSALKKTVIVVSLLPVLPSLAKNSEFVVCWAVSNEARLCW